MYLSPSRRDFLALGGAAGIASLLLPQAVQAAGDANSAAQSITREERLARIAKAQLLLREQGLSAPRR